jgi:hypothetical protein
VKRFAADRPSRRLRPAAVLSGPLAFSFINQASLCERPVDARSGRSRSAAGRYRRLKDQVEKVIGPYHSIRSISEGSSGFSAASNALTLLNGGAGLGGQGGINLLLSGL